MRKTRIALSPALLITTLLMLSATGAPADWTTDGTPVSTATGDQEYSTAASDGVGGVIVAWHDTRSGGSDVYAQRVNAEGVVRWTVDGVAICTAAGDQKYPRIVPGSAGSAVITWVDERSGNADIYAQRVDSTGAIQWAANGVALCTAVGDQTDPEITSDGAGGAIITWVDGRSGNDDIYAQRVSAAGAVQWTAGGVALCTATGTQTDPTIALDGAGGATIAWADNRSGVYHIYAQHVQSNGTPKWIADGVALCTAAVGRDDPEAIHDGWGGATVTWVDRRNINADIYAQRVDANAVVQWTANGVALCTATGTQEYPAIVSDGESGAIVTWEDKRSEWHIYAQRVDDTGAVQWAANGVALCTASGPHQRPKLVSDGEEGAIVAWCDGRRGTPPNCDIYAQRVDAAGSVQWAANGVALCMAAECQCRPTIASDGAGGAIVAWDDPRSGTDNDVYAQRITQSGIVGNALPVSMTTIAIIAIAAGALGLRRLRRSEITPAGAC
jgi:hypothetical protein